MRLPIRVRRALSAPFARIPVRVRSGPNQGVRWSLPVSGRGVRTGSFEPEKFDALAALLTEGDVFWDVGAHYGYASLLGSRRVGARGSVWSFEPSSFNREYLETHIRWNDAANTTILPMALADADGEESFGGRGGSISLRLGGGNERVTVRTFASLIDEGVPSPDLIKIDVEGAEVRLLEGARETIDAMPVTDRPTIFCSVHSPGLCETCRDLLADMGYAMLMSNPIADWLEGRDRWRGDPDILAIPVAPGLDVEAEADRLRRIPYFERAVRV